MSRILPLVLILFLSPRTAPAQQTSDHAQKLEVQRLLVRAMTLSYQNDYRGAQAALEQGLKMRPESPAILLEMALVQEKLGAVPAALFYLNQAVRLDSVHSEVPGQLARIQLLSGDIDGAVQTYSKAVADYPLNADLRLSYAGVLASLQQYEQAHELIIDALKTTGDRIDLLLLAADLARRLGREEELLNIQKKLTLIEPFESSHWRELGELFMRQGRWAEAAAAFQHALELSRDDTEIADALSEARLRMRRGEGQTELNAVTQAPDPDIPRTFSDLSGNALDRLRSAVRNNPDDIYALRILADSLIKGSPLEAASLYRHIVDLNPRNLDAWQRGIRSYIDSGHEAAALNMSEDALLLFPGYAPILSIRVDALADAGHLEEARMLLKKLLDSSDNPEYRRQMERLDRLPKK